MLLWDYLSITCGYLRSYLRSKSLYDSLIGPTRIGRSRTWTYAESGHERTTSWKFLSFFPQPPTKQTALSNLARALAKPLMAMTSSMMTTLKRKTSEERIWLQWKLGPLLVNPSKNIVVSSIGCAWTIRDSDCDFFVFFSVVTTGSIFALPPRKLWGKQVM